MPISKKRAHEAIDVLVGKGLITPDESLPLIDLVENKVSFRKWATDTLGKITGTLWMREELSQMYYLQDIKIDPNYLTVPEILLYQDDLLIEPWHKERFSRSDRVGRFCMEAAEPWHASLVSKYRKDPEVLAYFSQYPEYYQKAPDIVATAYSMVISQSD